jgi:GNAT superfamily N-acetyltransferase
MDGAARPATVDDLETIGALDADARESAALQRGGGLFLLRDAAPFDPVVLDDVDALVVVGTFDDVPVGYAVVRTELLADGSCLGIVHALYVDGEARDVGVGEAMMDLVLAWSHERGLRGLDAVALPGDRLTKNFFERFGLTARAIVVHRSFLAEP